MASSIVLASMIYDAERACDQIKKDEGGSRYLSLAATHLELAQFYTQRRIEEDAHVQGS